MRRIASLLALPAAALLGAAVALQWKDRAQDPEPPGDPAVGDHAVGNPAVGEHEVLGLALQRTTRAEAEQWAKDNGGRCTSGQHALRCTGVLDLEPVTFGFDAEERLTMVDYGVATHDPEQAARLFAEKAERLQERLGAPKGHRGEGTAAYLTSALLREAALSYRTPALNVQLTALQATQGRFLVREYHQRLRGDAPR